MAEYREAGSAQKQRLGIISGEGKHEPNTNGLKGGGGGRQSPVQSLRQES